jgi:N-acetylglucosaminyldiphosphoundecaprenol N-acetyl-beta-D-mannosaminyltransferase
MGCQVHNVDIHESVEWILSEAESPSPSFAVTPNVDHVVMLRKNPEFRAAYDRATISVADGMPLLWAARLKKTPLKQRVCGSDLIAPICAGARDRGLSIFLLGGRPGAADIAAERLQEQFPGLKIAGTSCPPMGFNTDPVENQRAIEQVRSVTPDILFVGLGAPKQELWLNDNLSQLGVPFSLGIGAGIDFTAGFVERAPAWMQNSGLEWAYRIFRDRRLAKRYLWKDLPFLGYLAKLGVLRLVRRITPAS